jgi:hypothetical protein
MRRGVERQQAEGGLIFGYRLLRPAQVVERIPQVVVGVCIVVIETQGEPVFPDRAQQVVVVLQVEGMTDVRFGQITSLHGVGNVNRTGRGLGGAGWRQAAEAEPRRHRRRYCF